jgi:DNA-binding transcriptional ArsR family regulator
MDTTNSTTENDTGTESNNQPTESDNPDWDAVGYVTASDHRTRVLNAVDDTSPTTPTQVSEEVGLDVSHVSRSLRDLKDRGLVDILNPDARKGRIYQLTTDGESVVEKVNEVGG